MSRRRNQIDGQFSARTIEMMESPAWRVVSLSVRRVIDRLEIELAHHGGTDNGKLPVTYDQFVEYGIHRHAVAPAIREAVALGFVEITRRGRAGNAEYRSPNLFRLTYKPAKGLLGHGTNEWRRIETMELAEAIAKAARTPLKKTKSQCRKTPDFSDENRHRKRKSPVPVSITTGHGTETITTSISRGGGKAEQQVALGRQRTGRERTQAPPNQAIADPFLAERLRNVDEGPRQPSDPPERVPLRGQCKRAAS